MAVARNAIRRPILGSTAFLLCDIQERFRPLISNFPHVVATADKMVKASRILGVPLIVTEQHPKALGATVAELDVSHAAMTLPKTKFSMWTPEVETLIVTNLKTKSAFLFGIESHVCVYQTALDLIRNNIDVYILADGVSSMHKGEVKVALKGLGDAGAIITTSESALFQLLGDANHPNFKEISNLVKATKQDTASAMEALIPNL